MGKCRDSVGGDLGREAFKSCTMTVTFSAGPDMAAP